MAMILCPVCNCFNLDQDVACAYCKRPLPEHAVAAPPVVSALEARASDSGQAFEAVRLDALADLQTGAELAASPQPAPRPRPRPTPHPQPRKQARAHTGQADPTFETLRRKRDQSEAAKRSFGQQLVRGALWAGFVWLLWHLVLHWGDSIGLWLLPGTPHD